MVFSPRGDRVLTSSFDRTARLWDADGQLVAVLLGHQSLLRRGGFSGDGSRAVTAGDDGTARLWDADTGDNLALYRGHAGVVRFASFLADQVVTAGDDGAILVRLASVDRWLRTACQRLEGHAQADSVAMVCAD